MYYLSSENKGADQLRGYREADLRLCFRLCRLLVFPCSGSNARNNPFMLVAFMLQNTKGTSAEYCKYGNVRENLVFANICELAVSLIQCSR